MILTCLKHGNEGVTCIGCYRLLEAQLGEARKDLYAYKGALGYAVPGYHDGKLSNGETPRCGMCGGRDNTIKELQARVEELTTELTNLVSYANTVRLDRLSDDDGTEMVKQTLPWAEGLIEEAERAEKVLNKSPQSLLTRRKLEGEVIAKARKAYHSCSYGLGQSQQCSDDRYELAVALDKLDALDQEEGR